jgi:hypothetical protein
MTRHCNNRVFDQKWQQPTLRELKLKAETNSLDVSKK